MLGGSGGGRGTVLRGALVKRRSGGGRGLFGCCGCCDKAVVKAKGGGVLLGDLVKWGAERVERELAWIMW